MKVVVFSTKSYDKEILTQVNKKYGHELSFLDVHLNQQTCKLAFGFEAVCVFVNDKLDKETLSALSKNGVRLIALRCAGFNNVDLVSAKDLNLTVVRVPVYSPHGVAEHTLALILALNRKIHRAYNRVREGNFSLEGLLGFELCAKTIGIVGTGHIGAVVTKIAQGLDMNVLAYDLKPNPECVQRGVKYIPLQELFQKSDIITLHAPLTKDSHHMINQETILQMKHGVMLINTSRGGLIDTAAVIKGLKSGRIGYLGLDVYEEEDKLFFDDLSGGVIQDDVFARLLTFPNVIITGHQAFLTENALSKIAETTLGNISSFSQGILDPQNVVK